MRPATRASAGFTLIEVLVALIVLSVGLLGLAALQQNAVKFNHGAELASQATSLAYDIVDRMRANRRAALNGAYDGQDFLGALPACNAAVAGATIAERDISAWRKALICALPLGNGRIERNAAAVTITIRWDESRGQNAVDQEFAVTTSL
jgi:type IV pilus assembly protein PilV